MTTTPTNDPAMTDTKSRGRAGAFALSGVINTLIDFLLLNICVFVFKIALLPANIISTSAALGLSYFLNNKWVFRGSIHSRKTVLLFLGITIFGLYVLQNIVIFALTADRTILAQGLHYAVSTLGLQAPGLAETNIAKAIATLVSAIWNYFMYKHFVFKKPQAA